MSYLGLEGQTILVTGLKNRKSVAWSIGQALKKEGARVLWSVRTEAGKEAIQSRCEGDPIFVCDVEDSEQIKALGESLKEYAPIQGLVHCIARAEYSDGLVPLEKTKRQDYLKATQISSFSLVELSGELKPYLDSKASVVSISISSTTLTAENYGYMASIKASLDANSRYLAKSFSKDTEIRFNTVGAGPLKTSSSAGIPGYMDNYLYAEKLTYRKKALATSEVAQTVLFLLSNASSGINGQTLVVDAGLGLNYFDAEIVQRAVRAPSES